MLPRSNFTNTMSIVLALVLCMSLHSATSQKLPVLDNGKIDLTNWDSQEDPVILLNGDWRFFWNKLIQWEEVSKSKASIYALMSYPWNEQIIQGEELPAIGYASYALEIIPPPGIDSLAFEVPAVFNSHALYVNGILVGKNGKVGTSENEMEPQWKPQTVIVDAHDTLHVIFQIANFQSSRGGCAESFRLGTVEALTGYSKISRTSVNIMIILFLMVGCVALLIYFKEKRNAWLYFAGLSLAFMLRFLFSDLYPYHNLIDFISWEVAARIEYASVPIIVIWGILFISEMYPLEFNKTVKNLFLALQGGLLLFVLILPTAYLSPVLTIIQLVSFAFLFYTIYTLGRALLYERYGAWTTIAGIGIFAFTGIYNLCVFWYLLELNRVVILLGYSAALILNGISLLYRTSVRISQERSNILRYSDLFSTDQILR